VSSTSAAGALRRQRRQALRALPDLKSIKLFPLDQQAAAAEYEQLVRCGAGPVGRQGSSGAGRGALGAAAVRVRAPAGVPACEAPSPRVSRLFFAAFSPPRRGALTWAASRLSRRRTAACMPAKLCARSAR